MPAFREVLDSKGRTPLRKIVLKRSDFADGWPSKPTEDVSIGLRKISDGDIQTAKAEAAKFAVEMHDDREGQVDAYNDALMRWLIISGTCDETDTGISSPLFDGSEENVRFALTSQAIRYIWDHIDRFHVEMNPIVPEASDEDILMLADRLLSAPLPAFSKRDEVQIRKFLGFVLRQIQDVEGEYVENVEDRVNPG